MPRGDLIEFRRGTAAAWASANPILSEGEPAFETDTGRLKCGDGVTHYNDLVFSSPDPLSNVTTLGNPITVAELTRLSGVTSNVQTQLNGKAALSHPHVTGDVTGLDTALADLQVNIDGKADTVHTQAISTVTGLQTALDAKGSQVSVDAKLPKAGGTMTGALVLSGAPLSALHAATKAYVDAIGNQMSVAFYNVLDYGVTNAGVDTTSALQALIATVYAAGGGTIYFPPGIYLIAGALQDTGVRNAQLVIPQTAVSAQPITITFAGTTAPPTQYIGSSMNLPLGTYSIIKSTLTGATGTAALFGADPVSGLYNNTRCIWKDLIFWMPANPTLSCLNMSRAVPGRFEHLMVHTGSTDQAVIAEPTHSNSYGIRLPGNNTGDYVYVEGVQVFGHYNGLQIGELTRIIFAESWGCINAFEFQFTFHASKIDELLSVWCQNGLVMAAGSVSPHYTTIALYDIEHSNGSGQSWQDRVADVLDAGNLLRGDVKWHSIAAAVGLDHSFVKSGGTHMIATELGAV